MAVGMERSAMEDRALLAGLVEAGVLELFAAGSRSEVRGFHYRLTERGEAWLCEIAATLPGADPFEEVGDGGGENPDQEHEAGRT